MSTFKSINHVSFLIGNLEKSLEFYNKVLGLEVNNARPNMSFQGAWLDINENQQIHLLQIDNPDPLDRPSHGGRDRHAAFIVSDLKSLEAKLNQFNISFTQSQSGRTALFCRDPDGNTLELME